LTSLKKKNFTTEGTKNTEFSLEEFFSVLSVNSVVSFFSGLLNKRDKIEEKL